MSESLAGKRVLLFIGGGFAIFALACMAGDPQTVAAGPAGFWLGLWHGMISVISFVISLFSENVEVYERNNNGAWYDLGFLFGILCIWGSGSKANYDRRRRRDEEHWEKIGRRIEAKVERKIREWSEAEPDEDWNVVEIKAEAKLKRKIREWALESE
jgi:hypothetical protein